MKAYLAAGNHKVDPACFFLSVDKPWMAEHGLIAWPGPDGKKSLFSTIVANPCVALGPIARDHLIGGFLPGVVYEVDVPMPLRQSPTSSWTNLRDLGIATMTLQPDGTVVVAPYVAPPPRLSTKPVATALAVAASLIPDDFEDFLSLVGAKDKEEFLSLVGVEEEDGFGDFDDFLSCEEPASDDADVEDLLS